METKPAVGRIVHYQSYGTPGGEFTPEHRAAIITETYENDSTIVGLAVLNPTGMFFNQEVEYADPLEGIVGGTWHWPERV